MVTLKLIRRNLMSFSQLFKKMHQNLWLMRLVVINSTSCKTRKTQQRYSFMSFMMMQPLLICINNQAIILNSIKQAVRWSCRNQFVCCKKSITDIGCSAAKSVATKIRNFLLYIALQKCVRTKAVLQRYFFRTSIIHLNVVK